MTIKPHWITEIRSHENVTIVVDIEMPESGISEQRYDGSLVIAGTNFDAIEVPIAVTVHPRPILPPEGILAITVAVIALVGTLGAALIRGRSKRT